MTHRFETGDPETLQDILREMTRLHSEGATFLGTIPPDVFARPQGGKWSPGDHVRHLAKSLRPVAMGLGLPRFVPRLLFGGGSGASRSFALMKTTYLERLAAGAQAGRFAPSTRPLPPDLGGWREGVLAQFREANSAVCAKALQWDERALDRVRMPHPALGKLTVREMLFFSLYHNAHHLNLVAGRLESGIA